jgi:hypothetical protein
MGKAGLLVLLYPLLLAVFLQSCHGQERKVNCCSTLNVQSYSTWDDSLVNNLCYVHAGSHCIHGRAASGRFFCFINAPFHARKSTWKVRCYFSLNVCLCLCFVFFLCCRDKYVAKQLKR